VCVCVCVCVCVAVRTRRCKRGDSMYVAYSPCHIYTEYMNICVYIHTPMYINIHVYTHANTHTHMHTHTHTHTDTRTHAHTNTHIHTHVCVHTNLYIPRLTTEGCVLCVCVRVLVRVCVCVCVYVCDFVCETKRAHAQSRVPERAEKDEMKVGEHTQERKKLHTRAHRNFKCFRKKDVDIVGLWYYHESITCTYTLFRCDIFTKDASAQ